MANGWTAERRARQSIAIKTWRPWERSTGPKTSEGKSIAANNAWKGGIRSILREVGASLNRHGQQLASLGLVSAPQPRCTAAPRRDGAAPTAAEASLRVIASTHKSPHPSIANPSDPGSGTEPTESKV